MYFCECWLCRCIVLCCLYCELFVDYECFFFEVVVEVVECVFGWFVCVCGGCG